MATLSHIVNFLEKFTYENFIKTNILIIFFFNSILKITFYNQQNYTFQKM